MDGRIANPEIPGVPEKSRSLDAQSLSDEKSRAPSGPEGRGLKRRRCSLKKNEENRLEQVKQRRKGRKEVSLSSLENVSKKSKKGLDSNKLGLKLNGFSLFRKNSSKKKNGNGMVSRNRNLQNSGNLTDLPCSLDDNVIVVPKRPRGFSGRNKFQSNHPGKQEVSSSTKGVISQLTTLSSNSSAEFSRSKSNGDPKEPVQDQPGKRKKVLDEFKDNSSDGTNIGSKFKGEDDGSVQVTSSRAAKRARRDNVKRRKSEGDNLTKVEVNRSLVDDLQIFEDLQEDDEENLEQNAARMLSSRFDPSCTGFSGRGTASKSQSADGSYFSPLFHGAFKSLDVDASLGLDTVSADSAGRVLRPRKQHKHKGFFKRQRRHFYEVCSIDLDPYWVVNQRIKVFWPLDQSWYFGTVKNYDLGTKLHHIKYDDRDEEWVNLQNERFKLLLLPGEVPGKSCPDKPELEAGKTGEDMDANFMDENCIGNFTDSEPIISWLSRSTHRMKSSPLAIAKKQMQSRVLKHLPQPIFSENSAVMPEGCMDVGPSIPYVNRSYMGSVKPDRSAVGEVSEKSFEAGACSADGKMPLVYFRRRFRNRCQGLTDMLVERSACRSTDGSVSLLAAVDRLEAVDEFEISSRSSGMKDLKMADKDSSLMCVENLVMMKFPFSHSKLEMGLKLNLLPLRAFDLAFGAQSFCLYSMLLLFKYGKMVTLWPNVRVEMLFVDNIVGLRYMLFEGCLKQAVAFLCFILTFFHQLKEYGQLGDLQLPVTSIRFKLLGLQGLGGQLEFVFYNYLELKSSKWLYLDNKLKQHCLVTKELPLSECTYANIKTVQSGSEQRYIAPVCQERVSLQKKSRQNTICRNCSSCKFDEKLGRLPPLVLSFAAAPTFFLSLHLNMLMENNVASISLQNQCRLSFNECSERFEELTGGDGSLVYDSFDQDSEITMENLWCSVRCTAPTSIDDGVDWKKTSQRPLNTTLDVSGASGVCQGKNISDKNVTGLENCSCHACSWRSTGKSGSSASECLCFLKKSENGALSHLNHISIQTSSLVDPGGQSSEHPRQTEKLSLNDLGTGSISDGTICSPNPTAPRSMWHRNRHGSLSSSFGYRSKLWPDSVNNGFVNGHKKPRTQVSYLMPFGGYSFGSKPRSQRQKAHRYKTIKNDSARVSDGSGTSQRYPMSISCDANVLVTVGDRGWRECGAQVVLESVDHKDWSLLVKISGTTKYSHKAQQFLQPGTTNRYTHAMMWKGGKDWVLEFPNRSQWILFKEMHEECYNRNIRAASVKNIPIPGVCLIDDSDHNILGVPFIRTQKYFRQIGTEVDMAMDTSRVFYDLESDDEEWISNLKCSSEENDGTKPLEISEEIFERVMDMFEKISYAQQCESFTSDEIEHFMVGVGPMDVIKAIYVFWQQKRQRKGIPLIRQLQPPLWEQYRHQVKEWELEMNKSLNFPDGCKEKVAKKKPPMFAFCLRPRGLEVPNKGTKQRSQRKFMVLGHHSGVLGELDGLHVNGRKLNGFAIGDEKTIVADKSYVSSDVSPLLQTSMSASLSDAAGPAILSMSSDWSERNQYPKLHRNKSKKVGMHLSPRSSQMASMQFNQRMMGVKSGACQWNVGVSEWQSPKHWQLDGFQRKSKSQLGGPDFDEFRLRDASGAARHALNMARLKRERANRLLMKADHALQKAVVALMTADAIKVSHKDSNSDG